MRFDDLLHAVAVGALSDIEDGFRTLVQWPGYDTLDGSSTRSRRATLRAVCGALTGNDRIMPGSLVDLLSTDFIGLKGATYADGARLVLDRWPAFSAQLAKTS